MAPVDFSGTWKVTKTENLDEFLQKLDVNVIKRKAAAAASTSVKQIIKQDGDKFSIQIKGPKDRSESFEIGKEFEVENEINGNKMKCLARWEGKNMIITATPLDGKKPPQEVVRQLISDTEMVITVILEGLVFKRFLKKSDCFVSRIYTLSKLLKL